MPLINTNVRIRDNVNGTYDENFTTGTDGVAKWTITTEYVQDSSSITYFTPHNITATYMKYSKEYFGYAVPEPRINKSKTVIIKLNVPGNYTILYPGWNLVSIPYIQSNSSIEAVLQAIEEYYDSVWLFNASDKIDQWKHYHVIKPPYMNDLNELDHKLGFWIYITSHEELGFPFNGTIPPTDQTIQLSPGWNLVGFPSAVNRLRDKALNNLQFGDDIYIIKYYDAKTYDWKNLETNEPMQKGVGYWFYSNSWLTWVVNSTIPPVHNLNKDIYYDTIQEGINDAEESNIIKIASGTFYEDVKINKSVHLIGNGNNRTIIIGSFNFTSDYVSLSSMGLHNTSNAIILDGVNEIVISDIVIYNCTYGLNINDSTNIDIEDCTLLNISYGMSSDNGSTNIYFTNSSLSGYSIFNFLLINSNITVLNSTIDATKIQFFDANSTLIIQWYLHVQTKDQLDYPINGTTIRIMDNENGTYDENYTTSSNGYARWIAVTERIYNLTENISFTPHNISVSHSGFSFYNDSCELVINKSTLATFISVNTVFETPIRNINRDRYYLTIQEAIDDANPYDTIQLSSGVYVENIDIYKPLTLNGESASSTFINGGGETCINITSNDVKISNLNIQNSTYGIYCNNSSPLIDHCTIANNTIGIIGFNSSSPIISNSTLQNYIFEFSLSNSYFTTLNTHFNTIKVMFLDTPSNLTVKWYFHVYVEDVLNDPIEGANVWITDNENGTFDDNYTTSWNGYVRWIAHTERVQNQSGNVSFNPYRINVSYYDPGEGWFTFPDNPRNITINGTLFEISTEIFTSLEAIPEFFDILMPMLATVAIFVVFKRRTKNIKP